MSGAAPGLPPLAPEGHVCAGCQLAYAGIDPTKVPELLSPRLVALTAALDAVPAEQAARRPDPDTWSVAEYVCHIRDVLLTYTLRLHRARVEDRPALEPMYNDLRARRFRYANTDPRAVVTELPRLAAGLADEVARVEPGDWDRRVTRLPGEERTARWLARSALHEVTHHLADVQRVAARVAADRSRPSSPVTLGSGQSRRLGTASQSFGTRPEPHLRHSGGAARHLGSIGTSRRLGSTVCRREASSIVQ